VVEVVDLGGNRIVSSLHVVSLELLAGAGRLRGPKRRWSRGGLVTFERLRIKLPGYDKALLATSAGLASAYTPPFGVTPHGIPHSIRVLQQPQPAVLTGATLLEVPIVFGLYDMYGEAVTVPPATALAPYVQPSASTSPKALADVCNKFCRANAYPIVLTVQGVTTRKNTMLRGGLGTQFTLRGHEATMHDGLATFGSVGLTIAEGYLSTAAALTATCTLPGTACL
jgi:hypothetical protein